MRCPDRTTIYMSALPLAQRINMAAESADPLSTLLPSCLSWCRLQHHWEWWNSSAGDAHASCVRCRSWPSQWLWAGSWRKAQGGCSCRLQGAYAQRALRGAGVCTAQPASSPVTLCYCKSIACKHDPPNWQPLLQVNTPADQRFGKRLYHVEPNVLRKRLSPSNLTGKRITLECE